MDVDGPMPGGNAGGAVRAGDTVVKPGGPWAASVHGLLLHLVEKDFAGAPTPLGIDEHGRQVLTFVEGETIGAQRPWPDWVYADDTLDQVADWMRAFHDAMEDFAPPRDAVWRMGGRWVPGQIVGHNDAAPYNAVWRSRRLVGFIDWDFAGPATREWDLAYVALSWVPLHARSVAAAEGFTAFSARAERLRRLLTRYGWEGDAAAFVELVQARAVSHAADIRRLAAAGDPTWVNLLAQGAAERMDAAVNELDGFVA
jgi:Ser/Thr protein kinase RdoA (MazF antagonist)